MKGESGISLSGVREAADELDVSGWVGSPFMLRWFGGWLRPAWGWCGGSLLGLGGGGGEGRPGGRGMPGPCMGVRFLPCISTLCHLVCFFCSLYVVVVVDF